MAVHSSNIATVLESEGVEFLLSGDTKVPLSSCNGKTVCLYFSANWCRPCKALTPQLVRLYEVLRLEGKEFEIIFISFDPNEEKFNEHFKCMPWLAVPFDANLHKRLSDMYRIDRIPSLISLSSDGLSIEEDLVGLIEDYGADAFPFTNKRREELKAADEAKREGGKIEELLTHQGRNHVLASDGREIQVSELVCKTVGLYFGAHWSPPCRAFTSKLIEAYEELMTSGDQDFEIILVSTDRDLKEFELNTSSMPWLAIPYQDKTRQDLCRIFDIKVIPALVLIGPNGKAISTNGKAMVSLHGAKAFPFTEARITELEAELRKEGEALPPQVKDLKHKHLLKLEMAKAYVCDYCQIQGRFWAFSCGVCDYDLHPNCVEKSL